MINDPGHLTLLSNPKWTQTLITAGDVRLGRPARLGSARLGPVRSGSARPGPPARLAGSAGRL